MMNFQKSPRSRIVLSWLALLLSVGVTSDVVVDVYEETDGALTAQSLPAGEETENVVEDLLIPSAKEVGPTAFTFFTELSIDYSDSPLSHDLPGCSHDRKRYPPGERDTRSIHAAYVCPLRI